MNHRINSKICFTILLPLAFISCKNVTESKLAYKDTETVKEIIKQKEAEISWTKELEPGRLDDPKVKEGYINSSEVTLSPDVVKILKNYNEPQYPELLDFGKLDTSSLSYSTLEKIQTFCSGLSKDIYSSVEAYFNSSYKFNYVFFRNDLISQWAKYFEEDFPLPEEDAKKRREQKQKNEQLKSQIAAMEDRIKEAENKKNQIEPEVEPEEENKDAESEKVEPKKEEPLPTVLDIEKLRKQIVTVSEFDLFDRWIMGEPFIGEDIIEIPVRFYCKAGTIDITLYLNQKKQNSIYQITIDRWCKL